MGILKFADKNAVERYTTKDGEDWIELRSNLSKGEQNRLMQALPVSMVQAAVSAEKEEEIDAVLVFRESPDLSNALFSAYASAWSLPFPCTLESYLQLSNEAAAWVDEQVYAHSNRDKALTKEEGKVPSTSRRGSQKVTSSPT